MKANQKTILFLVLTVIVGIVGGGIVVKKALIEKTKLKTSPTALLEFGQVLQVDEEELLALAVIEEEPVYDGMTLDELSQKLEKSLNDDISGKGYLIASYSLEKGVDPYIATAIILQETGCTWKCSKLVKSCHNVGGQKGKGCGSYRSFPSLEEGIIAFIDNLSKRYFSKGITTPEQINKTYAQDKTWYQKINSYVAKIKNK